jgi:hypothetical protein
MRYAGRTLDPSVVIALTADEGFARTNAGQAAIITAANLLGRMTESIALAFDDVELAPGMPWHGGSLRDFVRNTIMDANPFAKVTVGEEPPGSYRLHLGRSGAPWVAHGCAWLAYVGPAPSPLPEPENDCIFGAVFAAIFAIAKLFEAPFPKDVGRLVIDTFLWETPTQLRPHEWRAPALGQAWFVGAGSVGSAIAYFLALAGGKFEPTIVDMDVVKIENLDRSPVFLAEEALAQGTDDEVYKVDSLASFLRSAGIEARTHRRALNEVDCWLNRQPGPPDIVFAAANERNVRYVIEAGMPPIQIYGTTGQNWQASMVRHVPSRDPCSCCLFPPEMPADTACGSGKVTPADGSGQVDAALPFLSFAAGMMAAAEACKLSLSAYPFSDNRVLLYTRSDDPIHAAPLTHRPGCLCSDRSRSVHKAVVAGTRFSGLCTFT